MIDWMRMLYGQMEYRVKSDGEYSEAFQSLWGILAGDSLSPSFFDAYIHDFKPPTLPSDIVLQGTPIGNMELADDIVELTQLDRKRPDLAALQPKVHYTEVEYCARQVFFEMSVPKTRGLLFGATGEPISSLTVADGTPIIFDDKYRYGGILFSNTVGSRLFTPHYTFQADRARNAIYSLFAAEGYTGTIPIQVGLVLYRARVDCHLTYGCEVVIDVNEPGIRKLEKEQKRCLRRLNGVGPRSPTAPLFTETGIMPIRHRRIILALRFAQYALEEPPEHWVNRAYRDVLAMYRAGKKGWMRDMVRALAKLPFAPIALDVSSMESVHGILAVITQVEISCSKYLFNELASTRLPLLHGEDRGLLSDSIQSTLRLRPYLRNVTIPAHRKALFRFLCADHYLAIEQYRRVPRRDGEKIPVDQRPCRYCDACTESEIHALFFCNGIDKLVERRAVFMDRVKAIVPSHKPEYIRDNPIFCVHFYLEHKVLAPILAKFVYDVMDIFPRPERSKGLKEGKKKARAK
ncbi:hypothetical protein DFP72DRAFT_1017897 [Ephemerocybe angulata]|uniref:Reverse transcriptase domain-containing protein n=1 Tax=Ephemerocybe angulata TaxID=980116 RepID=A0A8H6HF21_9AGAR|nr:hypothetical protein DFP72DRAFT_1017897 [Tulosesus angulatus]